MFLNTFYGNNKKLVNFGKKLRTIFKEMRI